MCENLFIFLYNYIYIKLFYSDDDVHVWILLYISMVYGLYMEQDNYVYKFVHQYIYFHIVVADILKYSFVSW